VSATPHTSVGDRRPHPARSPARTFRGAGHNQNGGRRPLTLDELVLRGTFRRGRHEKLLAGELLAAEPPFGDRRRRVLWLQLRQAQLGYQQAETEARETAAAIDAEMLADGYEPVRIVDRDGIDMDSTEWYERHYVDVFSQLGRVLHGGRRPWWLKAD
jgi:hypothetical protein